MTGERRTSHARHRDPCRMGHPMAQSRPKGARAILQCDKPIPQLEPFVIDRISDERSFIVVIGVRLIRGSFEAAVDNQLIAQPDQLGVRGGRGRYRGRQQTGNGSA
jgi:hypothetical protein